MVLNNDDFDVGTGLVCSVESEDVLRLQLKIDEDSLIEEIEYKIFGRNTSVGAAKLLPTVLVGYSVDDILSLEADEISEDMIYNELVADAIRSAIADYLKKRIIDQDSQESDAESTKRFE